MRAPWTVHVSALPRGGAAPLAVDVVRWRIGGKLHLTVVAKATLALVHQTTARLEAPAELVRRDRHWEMNPARSLEAASDLAPYRQKTDVTLFGHAYTPPGRPRSATSVRLGVFAQRPLFVKTVQVVGDRVAAGPGNVKPFQRMPLVYERALKTADNPLGSEAPNLVDPQDRTRPASFGPLSSYWLQRRRALGALRREALEADVLELPEGFDWGFFQTAPPDQQVPFLHGDEWIALDGMHPALARFQSRLPSATVSARVYGPGGGKGYPMDLVADGLAIDADRQTCAVTWRRSFPVDGEEAASRLRILVGLALPDEQLAWPDLPAYGGPVHAPAPAPAAAPAAKADSLTQTIDVTAIAAEALPFIADLSGAPPAAREPPHVHEPPPPRPLGVEETRGFAVASLGAALPFLSAKPPVDDETTADAPPHPPQTLPFMRGQPAPPVGQGPPPPAPPAAARPVPFADMPIPDEEGTVEISASAAAGLRLPFAAQPFMPPVNPAPPPQYPVTMGGDPPYPPARPVPSGLPFAAPTAQAPAGLPFVAPPAPVPSGLPFSAPAPEAFAPPPAPPPPAPGSWPEAPPLPFAPMGAPAAPTMRGDPPYPPAQPVPLPAVARSARAPVRKAPGTVPTKPPPRITPEVPVTNRTPLLLWTLPWQVKPPQDVLAVVVKGTFELDPDGPVRLKGASDPPLGDVHVDDDLQKSCVYPSDFAIFKPKADVTLTGHAYPPRGVGPAGRVTFRFGSGQSRFDRTANVLGDRLWKPGLVANAMTDPAPFRKMPLVWERAFGGPRFEKNPVGAGHTGGEKAAQGMLLPNLEEPGKAMTAPSDTPEPVCFAPLSTSYKERFSKLGTYDARWLKTRWPYFPEDFDWAYFQSAPAAQRLEHLKGDEPFEIVGAHPQHTVIRGRLAGLRPRVFLHRTDEAGGAFEEIRLVLDTVAFDPDEMKVNLVWRGIVEVSEDEAPELAALFLMKEEAGEKPATLAQARERFLAALVPPEAVAAEPEDEQTAPANDAPPPPEADVDDAVVAEAKKRAAVLEAAGMGAMPAGAPPPMPDPEAIAASVKAAGASDEEVARLLEALRPDPPDAGAPPPDPRARAVEKLQADESFEGDDLAGADLSGLDFSGRNLAGANLKEARLSGALFYRANLEGAQMSGADLTDASLVEANLTGADLTATALGGANLTGAVVHLASFGEASAERACFFGARGAQAGFAGARLARADFREAELPSSDFSNADLGGASFEKAMLDSVRLFGAQAAGAKFDGAKMPGARADTGSFPSGSFKSVEAPESIWERADLTGATFHGAQLAGAGLSRIKGHGANFNGADMKEAKLRRAKLMEARFLKANLMNATLERADLTAADLRGANLHGAETLNAKLAGAKLDTAIVTKTKLKGRP